MEFRNEYAKAGIVKGQPTLKKGKGLNQTLCNAITEGGAKNGILTAIEDYLKQSAISFRFEQIPSNFGLGIIVTEKRLDSEPALKSCFDEMFSKAGLLKLLEAAEAHRIKQFYKLYEIWMKEEIDKVKK